MKVGDWSKLKRLKKTCKSYTLVCMINTDWKVSLNGREPNIGENKSESE